LAPFISEQIYCALTGRESVHLENWPSSKDAVADEAIGDAMTHTKRLSEMGNAKRREIGVAVKQPLASLTVAAPDEIISMLTPAHITLLCEELNVKKVIFQKNDELDVSYDTVITQQLADEGRVRDIVRSIQGERKKLGTSMDELVDVVLESWPAEFTDEIKKKAHVGTLVKGDAFSVVRR
jgi:isoleucyl-tRNA synthetase